MNDEYEIVMKNEGRSEVHLAIMVRKDKYAVREYNDERCMGLSGEPVQTCALVPRYEQSFD